MFMPEGITPAQWQTLCAGPWAVGLYVATAVGGKVQEVREMLVLGAALHRALERDYGDDLVGAVAATLLSQPPTTQPWALNPRDRAAQLAAVAAAAALAETFPQGRVYCNWLMDLANAVAAAEADGGLLGVAGVHTHQAERSALAELAECLGV